MTSCPRCGARWANPSCPICRRNEPAWEDPPPESMFDTVLLMIGIILVVATVLYFTWQAIGLLVR